MARTTIRGTQVTDSTIQRDDLDTTTAGQAVTRRVVAGTGVTLNSTGADTGTGDVTINATTPVPLEQAWVDKGDISGAGITYALSSGNGQRARLIGNVTSSSFTGFTNAKLCSVTIALIQDGTGGRTHVWPAAVNWEGGVAPTLSTAANSVDIFTFITWDGGTIVYGFLVRREAGSAGDMTVHEADTTSAHLAQYIPFTTTTDLTSTNARDAIEEARTRASSFASVYKWG